jgi:hypothetical protein
MEFDDVIQFFVEEPATATTIFGVLDVAKPKEQPAQVLVGKRSCARPERGDQFVELTHHSPARVLRSAFSSNRNLVAHTVRKWLTQAKVAKQT